MLDRRAAFGEKKVDVLAHSLHILVFLPTRNLFLVFIFCTWEVWSADLVEHKHPGYRCHNGLEVALQRKG